MKKSRVFYLARDWGGCYTLCRHRPELAESGGYSAPGEDDAQFVPAMAIDAITGFKLHRKTCQRVRIVDAAWLAELERAAKAGKADARKACRKFRKRLAPTGKETDDAE